MGRGGRRDNTGQKKKFTNEQEFEIGECCEYFYILRKERAERQKLAKRFPVIEEYYRKLDTWTYSERKKLDNPAFEAQFLDEFDLMIREIHEIDTQEDGDKSGVHITDFDAVPQGVRDRIKTVVAASIYRNHRISVSLEKIDKCWQMFRKFKYGKT